SAAAADAEDVGREVAPGDALVGRGGGLAVVRADEDIVTALFTLGGEEADAAVDARELLPADRVVGAAPVRALVVGEEVDEDHGRAAAKIGGRERRRDLLEVGADEDAHREPVPLEARRAAPLPEPEEIDRAAREL